MLFTWYSALTILIFIIFLLNNPGFEVHICYWDKIHYHSLIYFLKSPKLTPTVLNVVVVKITYININYENNISLYNFIALALYNQKRFCLIAIIQLIDSIKLT